MAIPVPVLVILGLFISAHARLNAVVLGQPVSASALDLIALAVLLTLVAGILWIIRTILRDGLQLRSQPVRTGAP